MDDKRPAYLSALTHPIFGRTCAAAALEPGTVHLWPIRVVEHEDADALLWNVLSAAEQQRALRIQVLAARREFVTGRAWLRVLAGEALHCDARSIVFQTGKHGKPWTEGLHFNVSHSHGMVLIGISADTEIGVDVEWEGREVEVLDVAEAICSPEELTQLRAMPPGEPLVQAFYSCWTRKEALLKAMGTGLWDGAREITVDFCSADLSAALQNGVLAGYAAPIRLPVGYQGAIGVLLDGRDIRVLKW